MVRWRYIVPLLISLPIVLGSMALTRWMKSPSGRTPVNQAVIRAQGPDLRSFETPRNELLRESPPGIHQSPKRADLLESCQEAARQLRAKLGPDCQVAVYSPFVLAGDASPAELDRWYRQTIGPASRALANCYFRIPPSEPITVLLFSGEASYNRYARLLYGDEGISVYGYYKPGQRTLVMNISTGGGTLVHELTHALIDFDFPSVPAWFNEGLASLHEQCHIREDESGIDGLVNWRLEGLQKAIDEGRLRSLKSLIGDNDFRGAEQSLNYAQARYFCLYLQERGVLDDFYHAFRAARRGDPLGLKTVEQLFADQSWEELDEAFRRWAGRLRR